MKDESTNPPGGSPRKAVAAVNQHVFGSFIDEYLVKPSIRKNSDFPPLSHHREKLRVKILTSSS